MTSRIIMPSFFPNAKILIVLFAAAVLLYSRGLGTHGVEYRDDEVFYYKSTQEMMQTGDYLSPKYFGENRFQKPILFYWLIILSYHFFGPTWFAARAVAVVFAGLSVAVSWVLAKDLFGRRVAFLSSGILMTFPMFVRHAKNAVPDMPLNFFILLAIALAVRFSANPKNKIDRYLFFLACGLGFMIKGWTALVIPGTVFMVHALWTRRADLLKQMNFPVGLVVLAAVILPWFLAMVLIHGENYTHYILVNETMHRVVSEHQELNTWYSPFQTFGRNSLFYLQAMLSYFAPWSVIGFLAIPLAMAAVARREPQREGLLWTVIWFWVVFLFFAFLKVKIQHYILILSTPFAILTANFLCGLDFNRAWQRRVEKSYFGILTAVSLVAFSFIHIVMIGGHPLWLAVYLSLLAVLLARIISTPSPFVPPAILALVMIFIFSRMGMLNASGLTSHATLQRMAVIVHKDWHDDDLVGVMSQDIHEKELQVYFDSKVELATHGFEPFTRQYINDLLSKPNEVYCLILEKDALKFQDELGKYPLETVAEDQILRKRFYLDQGFVTAVFRMDRPEIDKYLKEKIILLRKGPHA